MSRIAKVALSAALFSAVAGVFPRVVTADAPAGTEGKAKASANIAPRRSLERPLPDLKFSGAPLSEVIDFLADSTASNISVNWKALDQAHIAKDTPVTLRMAANVPLRKALHLVLQEAAGAGVLTYFVDDGVIEITTEDASDKVLISKTYPIQDLLFQATDYTNAPELSLQNASQGQSGGGGGGGGAGGSSGGLFSQSGSSSGNGQNPQGNTQKARADEIVKLITDSVKPELWQINGGTATISFYRGMLIVNAPRSIHELLESHE